MKTNELLKEIEIQKDEFDKAVYYFDYKGIELHKQIKDYLQSFKTDKVTYSELATAYRYDKRIRKILYKYIGLFEEHLRAFVCNRYSDNLEKINIIGPISKKINKLGSLYVALDNILFSILIEQVTKLNESDIEDLFPENQFLMKNIRAIVKLRNAVFHNRFLLDNLDFDECSFNGISSRSLHSNLINFGNHLDYNIRIEYLKEIEECKLEKVTNRTMQKRKHQTNWNLLKTIAIDISNS